MAALKPYLIGQAPSRSSDPTEPFSGRSGSVIAALVGLPKKHVLPMFERRNLFDAYPGKHGKGDRFDRVAARRRAILMIEELAGHQVVLVGRAVADAFLVSKSEPYMTWSRYHDAAVAVIPHPSGIVMWWNDPTNRSRAARFLTELLAPQLRRSKRCRSKRI